MLFCTFYITVVLLLSNYEVNFSKVQSANELEQQQHWQGVVNLPFAFATSLKNTDIKYILKYIGLGLTAIREQKFKLI
jgi:hypothetical protein